MVQAESPRNVMQLAVSCTCTRMHDVLDVLPGRRTAREAAAAELEERRLKLEREKAALMARLRRELLTEQPYRAGDSGTDDGGFSFFRRTLCGLPY